MANTYYEIFQKEKYGNVLKPIEMLHSVEDREAKSDIEDWLAKESELELIEITDEK